MNKKSKPLAQGGNIIPDLKEEFISHIMQEIPEQFLPAIQVAFEAAAYGMAKVFLSPTNLFQRGMLKQQLTQELEEWIESGDQGWDRWIAQMNGVQVFFEDWHKVAPSFLGKKLVGRGMNGKVLLGELMDHPEAGLCFSPFMLHSKPVEAMKAIQYVGGAIQKVCLLEEYEKVCGRVENHLQDREAFESYVPEGMIDKQRFEN